MRVLVQRVLRASVSVESRVCGAIDAGCLYLIGFGLGDDASKLEPMAEKLLSLRIFSDDRGKFSYSLLDVQGGVLAVPQFTLYGNPWEGRRPGFSRALPR